MAVKYDKKRVDEFLQKIVELNNQFYDVPQAIRWKLMTVCAIALIDADKINHTGENLTEDEFIEFNKVLLKNVRESEIKHIPISEILN